METANFTLRWEKARDYRQFRPDAFTVTATETTEGRRMFIHCTSVSFGVESETFEAIVDPKTGSTRQTGVSSYEREPIRILEATIVVPDTAVASLIGVLMQTSAVFPDDLRQQVMESIASLKPAVT